MSKARRAVELVKDALIILLACSALWLMTRSQVLGPVSRLFSKDAPLTGTGQAQGGERPDAARPLGVAAVLVREGGAVRYGVRSDESARDALFQRTAGLLVEALSSAGDPEPVSRGQWETALTARTGVCFDFQGEVPLPVLTRWLDGGQSKLTATVRRLLLADCQGTAALYYRDEGSGNYWRCRSEVVDLPRLEEALSGLTGNGVFYAFESEQYADLDPDTLLSQEAPAPAVFTASNPAAGGQAALEALASDLDFAINTNGVYYAGEWVARSGSDTLRLTSRGTVSYLAGEGESDRFRTSEDGLFGAVETCRRLAAAALGGRCGQARVYLVSAAETEGGWEVRFGYSLNGVPVQLEEGCAAGFLVENGRVTQFTLRVRSYADSGERRAVLPIRQAAAALTAGGLSGEELLLVYADGGGETVSAGWAAWREG